MKSLLLVLVVSLMVLFLGFSTKVSAASLYSELPPDTYVFETFGDSEEVIMVFSFPEPILWLVPNISEDSTSYPGEKLRILDTVIDYYFDEMEEREWYDISIITENNESYGVTIPGEFYLENWRYIDQALEAACLYDLEDGLAHGEIHYPLPYHSPYIALGTSGTLYAGDAPMVENSPVPEPSTIMLSLLGLGIVGFVSYKQRR